MKLRYDKIILTGRPGVGKTKLVINLLKRLSNDSNTTAPTTAKPTKTKRKKRPILPTVPFAKGFVTLAIRDAERDKRRAGFALRGLDGSRDYLAHQNFHASSAYRVGRFGVNVFAFDEFCENLRLLADANQRNPTTTLIVLDEIGKMELFSGAFRRLVREVLASGKQVLATVPLISNDPLVEAIKARPDVHLRVVDEFNRKSLLHELLVPDDENDNENDNDE